MAKYNITLHDNSAMSSVGHIIDEDPQLTDDSSDTAYNADTTIDSPTSTSTTLQLHLSEDDNDQNGVNDNDIDEDQTGSHVCAMHSYKHLTSSCSGCQCQCKARNMDGIVVDSETEEDDPGLYALLGDRHERSAEDDERAYEDAELPALLVNLVHNEHSEDDSQEDIFFRN